MIVAIADAVILVLVGSLVRLVLCRIVCGCLVRVGRLRAVGRFLRLR